MTRNDWLKTPYAATDAKNPQADVTRLLDRYRIVNRQWTEHPGPNGRPAVTLRFELRSKTYRMTIETLAVERAEPAELAKQAMRVIYWTLKPVLENLLVFMPPERALLPYLETPEGPTVYDGLVPHLPKLTANDLLGFAAKALPAPTDAH